MFTAEQILNSKGTEVCTLPPTATVREALELMAEQSIGAIVVCEGLHVVGILSERDYARKVILHGRASATTKVHEIMSAPVITAERDWNVERCMRVMTEQRVRHLPVIDAGRLCGIISIGDVVKAVINNQRAALEQLSDYVQISLPQAT